MRKDLFIFVQTIHGVADNLIDRGSKNFSQAHQLIISDDSATVFDPADCLLVNLNAGKLHFGDNLVLGEAFLFSEVLDLRTGEIVRFVKSKYFHF